MLRRLVLIVSVAVLVACKHDEPRSDPAPRAAHEVIQRLAVLRSHMCNCKDRSCAAAIDLERRKLAGAGQLSIPGSQVPTAAEQATLATLNDEYQACVVRWPNAAAEASAGSGTTTPPPATTTTTDVPALPAAPAAADDVVRRARTFAQAMQPPLTIGQLLIRYVDAQGVLDPVHGSIIIQLDRPTELVDDPDRKLGAPVVPAAAATTRCPILTFKAGRWGRVDTTCRDASTYIPRCTAASIWQRALAKQAPVEALAVIQIEAVYSRRPRWRFSITDDLRKVEIQHRFDDDCDLVVEQPVTTPPAEQPR